MAATEAQMHAPADDVAEEWPALGGEEGYQLPAREQGVRRGGVGIGSGPSGAVRRDVERRAGPCGAGQREGGHAIHGGVA